MRDTALVLLGHGSTVNAGSAEPVYRHAAALRERGIFQQVLEGFWKQEPSLAGVLRGVWAKRAVVVPLFTTEGYFTQTVLPRELGFSQLADGTGYATRMVRDNADVYYTRPVGTHPRMAEALERRARQIVLDRPFPVAPKPGDTSLVLVGHGTARDPNSRRTLESHAALIRSRSEYGEVLATFMEEPPLIADVYELALRRNVVVVPFFVSDGLHAYEDIPVLLGEPEAQVRDRVARGLEVWRNPTERRGKRVWLASSLGSEPWISEVILQRAREAVAAVELSGLNIPAKSASLEHRPEV